MAPLGKRAPRRSFSARSPRPAARSPTSPRSTSASAPARAAARAGEAPSRRLRPATSEPPGCSCRRRGARWPARTWRGCAARRMARRCACATTTSSCTSALSAARRGRRRRSSAALEQVRVEALGASRMAGRRRQSRAARTPRAIAARPAARATSEADLAEALELYAQREPARASACRAEQRERQLDDWRRMAGEPDRRRTGAMLRSASGAPGGLRPPACARCSPISVWPRSLGEQPEDPEPDQSEASEEEQTASTDDGHGRRRRRGRRAGAEREPTPAPAPTTAAEAGAERATARTTPPLRAPTTRTATARRRSRRRSTCRRAARRSAYRVFTTQVRRGGRGQRAVQPGRARAGCAAQLDQQLHRVSRA